MCHINVISLVHKSGTHLVLNSYCEFVMNASHENKKIIPFTVTQTAIRLPISASNVIMKSVFEYVSANNDLLLTRNYLSPQFLFLLCSSFISLIEWYIVTTHAMQQKIFQILRLYRTK